MKSLNKSWKSRKSQIISTISMKISTQLNLNWKVLILKNLDPAKKKSCLDSKDNLYRFEKLISAYREVWISIGLDCWDPQAHKKTFFHFFLLLTKLGNWSDWLIETFQSKLWPVKIFAKIVETCDSYPQMSLFVRWNNNLKNTHFSITW